MKVDTKLSGIGFSSGQGIYVSGVVLTFTSVLWYSLHYSSTRKGVSNMTIRVVEKVYA